MPRPVAYIAQVLPLSGDLREKINNKHGVAEHEVHEAVVLCDVESSNWHYDDTPGRGWQLLVTGTTYAGRRLFVVLYPVNEDDGVWRLATAIEDQ